MNRREAFIRYDLFKLIVALILLVIVIWLWLRTPQTAATAAPAKTQAAPSSLTSTAGISPSSRPTRSEVLQPGSTPKPAEITPAATSTAAQGQTTTPADTSALEAQATPDTLTGTPTLIAVDCPLAIPSRLKIGDTARVLAKLYIRSAPQIGYNVILSSPAGAQLKIIGGPVCGPYLGHAYLWWQVERDDGKSGWSAEGTLNGSAYFIEPVE